MPLCKAMGRWRSLGVEEVDEGREDKEVEEGDEDNRVEETD